MSTSKKVFVVLNGGIGNQLFGMAAALSVSDKIGVIGKISNASLNKEGKPEILSLLQGEQIEYLEPFKWFAPLLSKIHNYLLISKLGSREHWSFRLYPLIYWSLYKSIQLIFGSNFHLCVADDIGYVEIPTEKNVLLIGYFQSYRWLEFENVQRVLASKLSKPSGSIGELTAQELSRKPIMVHIMLGDYRKEENFGIVSKMYYDKALAQLTNQFPNSPIWIFSDEPQNCREFIDESFFSKCFWISEKYALNALETLVVMRYGIGYVIANSTFSWWSAALAIQTDARVYCPSPWFKTGPTPRDLIPKHWRIIPR